MRNSKILLSVSGVLFNRRNGRSGVLALQAQGLGSLHRCSLSVFSKLPDIIAPFSKSCLLLCPFQGSQAGVMGTRTLWPENPAFLHRGKVGRLSPVAQNLLQVFLSYAQRCCVALQPPFPSVPWLRGAVCAGKISEQPNGLDSVLLSFPPVLLFLDKGCWWGPLSHRSLPSGKPFGLSEVLLKPGLAISHGRGSALSCD